MELKIFNQSVNNRFQTVIKTIEDKSNSFFDSYLNLLEGTIKFILDENNISYDTSKTCGLIFRTEEVKSFFLNRINIDDKIYDKVLDYVKKSNDSKHKVEKQIDVNAVLVRMEFYYSFINKYCEYKSEEKLMFNENFYFVLFGKTERINKEFKEELSKKRTELENAYLNKELAEEEYNKCKELLEYSELEKLSLNEQNNIMRNQISILTEISNKIIIDNKLESLEKKIDSIIVGKYSNSYDNGLRYENKDKENKFIRGAKKEYAWIDLNLVSLENRKLQIWFSGLAVLVFGLIASICVTNLEFYTTYTFFSNIYMFEVLLIMLYSLCYKEKMSDYELFKKTNKKLVYDFDMKSYNYCGKEKKRYKIIRIIAYICPILDVICKINSKKFIFVLIHELLFIASMIVFEVFKNKLNSGYEILLLFTNKNDEGKEVTIAYNFLLQRYNTKEELDSIKKNYNVKIE